jgi:indole-3-glycerol phosphate synthase
MSTFLERILEQKKREVEALYAENLHLQFENQIGKATLQQREQKQQMLQQAKRSLVAALTTAAGSGRLGVIAEIKRASPSRGIINEEFDISERACAYAAGGAAAISVLTDRTYFHGSISDLEAVIQTTHLPVLRKDFIIDELQIEESCLAGANAVLLIAAALSGERLARLSAYAKRFGLDVLIEVHEQNEVEAALAAAPSVLGINNRNLHSFEVSLETTIGILQTLPRTCPVISESGIHSLNDVRKIAKAGIDGLLIGESLMKENSREQLGRTIAAYSASASVSTSVSVFAPTESGCMA